LPAVGAPSPPDKEPIARRIGRRTAIAGLVGTILLIVSGCIGAPEGGWPGFFAPPAASTGGDATDALYFYVFLVAVGVFLVVEGLLLWIVLRYRRRPRTPDELPPQTHGNNLLEVIWTLIPAAIVTMLFVATVQTLTVVEDFAAEPDGVVIEVTGFQWQWTFNYPDEGLSFTGAGNVGPVMALPVNERVRIRMEATDVIHSFYVPMFRYKQDVVPGRVNEFDLVVNEPGTYTGQCAEFCGLLHYEMFFTVEAMSRADYDAWVVARQEEQAAQPSPPPEGEGHTITLASPDSFTFDPPDLTAPADTPIIFDFRNVDLQQPHNVAIVDAEGPGQDWVGMPIAAAGENTTYVSPPLPAGTYVFYCSVHPLTMRGTLTVGP
jgi:cytochrome c oxidase subunit II